MEAADPIIDWKLKNASKTINIVIVGRIGNGKSATGNSILGREAFLSKYSFLAVTCSSELQGTMLKDGRTINVIDTPGFNFSTSADVLSAEIAKSINLAKDGIHAVLMVFSFKSRISIEEEATIEIIKSLFGDKIVDYMILVFTNGDILESKHYNLKDFIRESPESLTNIIQVCKNRIIIFDNTTEDKIKREKQVNELLSLVEFVIMENGGKPYSNKIFEELKERALLRHQKNIKSHDDEQKLVAEMVDEKVKLSMEGFLKQQVEERTARLEAELRDERLGRESLNEEIRKLKEDLNEIRGQYEEFKKRKAKGQICAIL